RPPAGAVECRPHRTRRTSVVALRSVMGRPPRRLLVRAQPFRRGGPRREPDFRRATHAGTGPTAPAVGPAHQSGVPAGVRSPAAHGNGVGSHRYPGGPGVARRAAARAAAAAGSGACPAGTEMRPGIFLLLFPILYGLLHLAYFWLPDPVLRDF